MTAGQCVQSIDQAHNSTIMSLLAWEVCISIKPLEKPNCTGGD